MDIAIIVILIFLVGLVLLLVGMSWYDSKRYPDAGHTLPETIFDILFLTWLFGRDD
jgi:hypothetical protein